MEKREEIQSLKETKEKRENMNFDVQVEVTQLESEIERIQSQVEHYQQEIQRREMIVNDGQ